MAGTWVRRLDREIVELAWFEHGRVTPVAQALRGTDMAETLMRATDREIQAGLRGIGQGAIGTQEGRERAAWEIHRARYQNRNKIDDREVATVRGLARDLVTRGDLDLGEVADAAGLTLEHLVAIIEDRRPMTARLTWLLPLMADLAQIRSERELKEASRGLWH